MYSREKTHANKKKKKHQGNAAIDTQVGEDRKKKVGIRGGNSKVKMISAKFVNVLSNGAHIKCEVKEVGENPASRDLTRRNIITRGAILNVKTPKGDSIKAKVTSRPGQDGTVNAVAVE